MIKYAIKQVQGLYAGKYVTETGYTSNVIMATWFDSKEKATEVCKRDEEVTRVKITIKSKCNK